MERHRDQYVLPQITRQVHFNNAENIDTIARHKVKQAYEIKQKDLKHQINLINQEFIKNQIKSS